jgi:hypothetical protein
MPSAKVIIIVGVLATSIALPSSKAETLRTHPRLVHRQIGAGWTLALEAARTEKTFFVCGPNKTDCVSTKAIGWRKPFIIMQDGNLLSPGYNAVSTETQKFVNGPGSGLPSYLKSVPVYPAAAAWEKLSPTKRQW